MMAAFCQEEYRCRREILLEHFGEKFAREQCRGTCDNCKRVNAANAQIVLRDVTPAAEIVIKMLRTVSGLSASSLAKAFRGLKDTSAAGKEAARQGCVGAGKSLNMKANEVDKVIRRMITLGLIEEQLETHEGRATIAKLAVDERKLDELRAGGQRALKVEITEIGKAGSAGRATSPAAAAPKINGAGPSKAVAIAAAPAEKKTKAASKRRAKGTAMAAAVPATTAAPVINLVSSSDEEEEEVDDEAAYFAQNPEAKLRFDVMLTMLRQLSIVLKEHTRGKRIPLSTAVQQKLAKNPPSTPDEMDGITIAGFNNHMKKRFGPALLAGVAQADAHLVAVKAEVATIEDFVLDKATVLAGLDPGVNRGGNGVGGGLQPQPQYFYPQPPKNSANVNATGSGNKRPRDEDLDWGDDSDDDDDAWVGAALNKAHPAALAPYQQQQQQQQQYNNSIRSNYAPQALRTTANTVSFPTDISTGRPNHNTTHNNDAIPLAQRQRQLKAKLQRDVALQGNTNDNTRAPVLPYTALPGQVNSMAVMDINNAFG
ncbi:hypothetical protein KSW81_007206 [Nannochloris sp. 'desiccata']|nr:hypothetical protein KSW81_007206 [Chlorella desiccata (nom. nud.)]